MGSLMEGGVCVGGLCSYSEGTTEIVLFTSNVWLHLIELQSCCNSDWPVIDLCSDGKRQLN